MSVVDPPALTSRHPMLLQTVRIGDAATKNEKTLQERMLQETCDVCNAEFVEGDVAVYLGDGGGITNFWHRRCVTRTLESSPEDREVVDAKFEAIASTWGREGV